MNELDLIESVLLVVFLAVPLVGVADAARLPRSAWEGAGRSKRFWILLQLLTLYLGAIAYFAGVRRDVVFFTAPRAPDWEEAGQS
ncbi:MAG TPA: hypothetical protein VHL54_07760 [Actinomycetota bacterium]|nr:hypothetical protein [Actinomycetota bacterium]